MNHQAGDLVVEIDIQDGFWRCGEPDLFIERPTLTTPKVIDETGLTSSGGQTVNTTIVSRVRND